MGRMLCEIYANYYRERLEKNDFITEEEREMCKREIRINDFLSTCDDKDICLLYDSTLFNEITIRYAEKALEVLDADSDFITEVRYAIKDLHEIFDAE